MYANRRALELTGSVKLDWKKDRESQWITYRNESENPEVLIDFNASTTENNLPLTAGLHYDSFDDIMRRAPINPDTIVASLDAGRYMGLPLTANV